jgi:hypothetical protein
MTQLQESNCVREALSVTFCGTTWNPRGKLYRFAARMRGQNYVIDLEVVKETQRSAWDSVGLFTRC